MHAYRPPVLRTSKTGSNTSVRSSRSAQFTWRGHWRSPSIFPNLPQPNTRAAGTIPGQWNLSVLLYVFLCLGICNHCSSLLLKILFNVIIGQNSCFKVFATVFNYSVLEVYFNMQNRHVVCTVTCLQLFGCNLTLAVKQTQQRTWVWCYIWFKVGLFFLLNNFYLYVICFSFCMLTLFVYSTLLLCVGRYVYWLVFGFSHSVWFIICRDGEDLDSQGDGSSQPDTISLASRTSQNTLDSDKVREQPFYITYTTISSILMCSVLGTVEADECSPFSASAVWRLWADGGHPRFLGWEQ